VSARDTTFLDASATRSDDEGGDEIAVAAPTTRALGSIASPSYASSSTPPRVPFDLFAVPDDGPAGAGTPAETGERDDDEDPYL